MKCHSTQSPVYFFSHERIFKQGAFGQKQVFFSSQRILRLAYGVGSGYSTVRHARSVAQTYDSDLLSPLDGIIMVHVSPKNDFECVLMSAPNDILNVTSAY